MAMERKAWTRTAILEAWALRQFGRLTRPQPSDIRKGRSGADYEEQAMLYVQTTKGYPRVRHLLLYWCEDKALPMNSDIQPGESREVALYRQRDEIDTFLRALDQRMKEQPFVPLPPPDDDDAEAIANEVNGR